MTTKTFWLDLETTGLSPVRHSITQLACLAEIDGQIDRELNLFMRPMLNREVDPDALAVSGITEDQIRAFPHPEEAYHSLISFLQYYINKYDKLDKFIIAGYNVEQFDGPFLRQFFIDNAATRDERAKGGYFGSWFFWPMRNVQTYLTEHITDYGLRLPNYKLETVCVGFAP